MVLIQSFECTIMVDSIVLMFDWTWIMLLTISIIKLFCLIKHKILNLMLDIRKKIILKMKIIWKENKEDNGIVDKNQR
jgi:hypothetical protein